MREQISEYIHNQWWRWAKTLIDSETLSEERVKRWTEECFMPYEDLSEEQKDMDRMFADQVLGLINSTSNSYLNDRKAIDRIKREYQEHGKLIIGFDFDCTVYDYHKEGLELQPVIDLLKRCSDLGFTMCLYTLPDNLDFKIKYIQSEFNIQDFYVNGSPIMRNNVKPYFNILLDDRAGLSASYSILKTTLKELELWD